MLLNPYRCTHHPDREAGWRCPSCGRQLCPDCTAEAVGHNGFTTYPVCAHCDQLVEQLTVTGAPVDVRFRMAETFRMPVGVFSIGLLVVLFFGFRTINLLQAPLPTGALAVVLGAAFWFVFFSVVHSAGSGTDELRAVINVEARQFILLPAARAVAWSAAWFCPLLAVQALRGLRPELWLEDPLAWAWCLSASAVAPAALSLLASGKSARTALSPGALRQAIAAIGEDYKPAAGLVVGAGVFSFILIASSDYAIRHGLRHFVPTFLRALALYAQLFTARVVGLLLDVRGYALGYPLAPTRQVPVLPDERPRAKRMQKPHEPKAPVERAPVELTPERGPGSEPTAAQRVSLVLAALKENQIDEAVAEYARVPEVADNWFSAESQLALGQAAAARGQYALAVRAWKHAAQRAPDGPVAPKACVLLARLYAERLGDAEAAGKLYRYVVQRYPDTEAARFAQEQLPAP